MFGFNLEQRVDSFKFETYFSVLNKEIGWKDNKDMRYASNLTENVPNIKDSSGYFCLLISKSHPFFIESVFITKVFNSIEYSLF